MLLPTRILRGEIMDGPGLDAAAHRQALDGLQRINHWSSSAQVFWRAMPPAVRRMKSPPLRVLDVAGGGGDVAIALARLAASDGIELDVTLLDRSATALEYAGQKAAQANVALRQFQGDALVDAWPGQFDVVICSLFLHHLREDEVVGLLKRMVNSARQLVLISDLRRCAAGWAVAWLGCHLLSQSSIVHHDGPVSVEAAWTVRELDDLARKAGLSGARIERCRPWRMLLSWRPDQPEGRQ